MSTALPTGPARGVRLAELLTGAGMALFALWTVQHFFAANYPATIWAGSFCDISAFFNCDSSAFSSIAAVAGVPIGFFGFMVGALYMLGALFGAPALQATNRTLLFLNLAGVVLLLLYSVIVLGSLCLLCSGFYITSGVAFYLTWRKGRDGGTAGFFRHYLRPSLRVLGVFTVAVLLGAWGMRLYHQARQDAQSGGVAGRIVEQYFGLPVVGNPSLISPYWSVRSTEAFEDAPIQIVEYADFLCPDCLFLYEQLDILKKEFAGKINIAFQFFPLEAACNSVVEKDLHPGACDITYIAAHDPDTFPVVHDEIFASFRDARDPEWRDAFAARIGASEARTDPRIRDMVERIIQTGAEYEKTSDRYSHGIRSTPTMIINGRLVIGTFPIEQLRAIFQALVDDAETGGGRFLENWEERTRPSRPPRD